MQVGLAGVHADPYLDRVAVGPGQRASLADELQRTSHSPLGVVLVRPGEAEHGEHGVADELLHGAAVLLDEPSRQGVVALQQPVDQLVVGGLRVRREGDEVAEQRGDDLALLGKSRRSCRRLTSDRGGRRRGTHLLDGRQPSPAVRTEGELGRVLATAGRAGVHETPTSASSPRSLRAPASPRAARRSRARPRAPALPRALCRAPPGSAPARAAPAPPRRARRSRASGRRRRRSRPPPPRARRAPRRGAPDTLSGCARAWVTLARCPEPGQWRDRGPRRSKRHVSGSGTSRRSRRCCVGAGRAVVGIRSETGRAQSPR